MVAADAEIGDFFVFFYQGKLKVIVSYDGPGFSETEFSGTVVSSESEHTQHAIGVKSSGWSRQGFAPMKLTVSYEFTPFDNTFPHKCPKCNGPAYVGFNSYDCKNKCEVSNG